MRRNVSRSETRAAESRLYNGAGTHKRSHTAVIYYFIIYALAAG